MASRRPASSRARYNNEIITQQPRSKSVMAKPIAASSSRTTEDQERSNDTSIPQRSRNKDDGETNIQVILRCRGRSEREVVENSPAIVQIEGPKRKDLTVETSTPVSSLGMVTSPPTRTYPFDLVFGPEATQSMIYHEVVGPMLAEVLMGYNCTLFAYGQTGTGKTYTMQGDLSPTPMGNPSTNAGVIPRVLFRLFHELEKSYTDFIVKISFVELYNEELRDLLAFDLGVPTSLTQPMGMAAKDAKAVDGGLKIFDEASKRGVFIQGLEEIPVTDSTHALALLTKGSERRQIAATKFNDHSSRSHSVFSITVHLKEKNNMGDDLLKIGKLNLVDLAGSENIGRSGAESKRAREAGMINQSLLTLGRVINALVDKAQHVPYRESKLTRLLQDSLGGRTKTCIIATISPARSNLEETLSTLDYALRAKSIRNKPELNQRMNRNSLLKEYVAEIDRLKSDLLAAREKNGIYFSEESWNKMTVENELRQTELVEAKKQVSIIENQLRNVRDEFDQSIALLKLKEQDLQTTKSHLQQKEETLRQRDIDLRQITDAYKEEVIVRQAHQETEVALNDVALGLKDITAQSLRDISALFEKLDRKNKVFQSNKKIASESQKLVHSSTDALMRKLAEMSQLSHSLGKSLEQETQLFHSTEEKEKSEHIRRIDTYFSTIQQLFKKVKTQEGIEDQNLISLEQELQSATSSFKSNVSTWSEELTSTCALRCNELNDAGIKQLSLLTQSMATLHSLAESICREVRDHLKNEQESLTQSYEVAKKLTSEEISHLRQQNETLANMLVEERRNSEKAKSELLQQMSGLLGEFLQKRDESLRGSIGNLQRNNKEAEDLLASTSRRHLQVHNGIIQQNEEISGFLVDVETQVTGTRKDAAQATRKMQEVLKIGIDQVQHAIVDSVTGYSHRAHKRLEEMEETCSHALEEHARAKKARIDATDAMNPNLTQWRAEEQSGWASSSKRTESYTSKALSYIQDQGRGAKDYEDFAMDNLESIEQAANNLLSKGIKDDLATGSTPRKRKWQYTDEWTLTRSRDELLSSRRRRTPPGDDHEMQSERLASTESENEVPHIEVPHSTTKVEPLKTEFTVEPLVESRRRNVSTTRRASRRAR